MSPNDSAVHFEDVVKRYRGPAGDFDALRHVDLDVHRGELFALVGPNGAGKTTSIEIMVGLRRPTTGRVQVLGLDPQRQRTDIRQVVAIQPQKAAVFERQTVAELLRVWASFYPHPETPDSIMARLGLVDCRDTRIAKLSGGQQQRVLVGLALVARPKLLVLDEPSTGMDPNARQELWNSLRAYRRSGGTVLLSTHSMEEAEMLCDRVAVLHRGQIVACGTPDELIREHAPEREVLFTVPVGRDLAALDGYATVIETVAGSGGGIRVRVRTSDSDAVVKILAGPLEARQIEMNDAGLDAVFRRLTGTSFEAAAESPIDETAPQAPLEVVAS
jgi:ABC-2 type transport system ATP-binding protein